MDADLRRIRAIADFQYGPGAGAALFPDEVHIVHSRNTGRIRHIYIDKELQATFRPTDGVFTLTMAAAKRLMERVPDLVYAIEVNDDAAEFIAKGKNVFAKHVTRAGDKFRPGDEVIITSKQGVIGVGKALLLAEEMKVFKTGVAVRTRRGCETDT